MDLTDESVERGAKGAIAEVREVDQVPERDNVGGESYIHGVSPTHGAPQAKLSRWSLSRVLYAVAFFVAVAGGAFTAGFRFGQQVPMLLEAYLGSELHACPVAQPPAAPGVTAPEPAPEPAQEAEGEGPVATEEGLEVPPPRRGACLALRRRMRGGLWLPPLEGVRTLQREAPAGERRTVYAQQDG